VWASIGTTAEAGTISSARPQRNTAYRPSLLNNRDKPFSFPSFSLPHITDKCIASKSGSSNAPPTPGYTPHQVLLGTPAQLWSATNITTVDVAGSTLPVASKLKSLGVTIDSNLRFDCHARNVAKACNFHTRALRHVRSLLTDDVAQIVACSIVTSRLDYCNAVLSGAPAATFDKLQRAQNNLARVVCTDARPLLHSLHLLPVRQRVTYKLAVLTRKVRTTATRTYLGELVQTCAPPRALRSSDAPMLVIPRIHTELARHAFSVAAPSTWNSLPADIQLCAKHSHFQTSLENPSIQTHLVLLCCIKRLCIFGPKGAIQIRYYYYYYYSFPFSQGLRIGTS